jgi:hypothetical protein
MSDSHRRLVERSAADLQPESNRAIRRATRDAGYRFAFYVENGCTRGGVDRYRIQRIESLRKEIGWRFLWKVLTASRTLTWSEAS